MMGTISNDMTPRAGQETEMDSRRKERLYAHVQGILDKHDGATVAAVNELKAAGWKIASGEVPYGDDEMYYPGRAGGGYANADVAVELEIQIEHGGPAYHGTVAYLPLA